MAKFGVPGWCALVLVVLLSAGASARGEIFKWIDSDGQLHVSDQPPERNIGRRLGMRVIGTYPGVSVEPIGALSSSDVVSDRVLIYTTQSCKPCEYAKAHLDQQYIPFTEYSLDHSQAARVELKQLGGTGVPFILVGDYVMKGFNAKRFDALWSRRSTD